MAMRKRFFLQCSVVIFLLGILAAPVLAQNPVKARFFIGTTPQFASIFVAENKGYYKEFGVDMEVKIFTSGSAAAEAFRAGKGEFVNAGDWPSTKLWEREEAIGISPTNYYTKMSCITGKMGLKNAKDLKGKKIGAWMGSTSEYFLLLYLAKAGMTIKDIEVKNLQPADMVYSLDRGDIDAFVIWEPFCTQSTQDISKGKTHIISYGTGYFTEWMINSTSPQFAKEHPDAVVGVLRALDKADKFIKNNPDETFQIVAKRLRLKEPLVKDLVPRMVFDVTYSKAFRSDMNKLADFMMNKNVLKKPIDWKKVFNPSFLIKVNPVLVEE
jgi:aliphatic sulfonates family ABC transporter substrate-binding protein